MIAAIQPMASIRQERVRVNVVSERPLRTFLHIVGKYVFNQVRVRLMFPKVRLIKLFKTKPSNTSGVSLLCLTIYTNIYLHCKNSDKK